MILVSEKINIFFSVASAPQDRGLFDELQKHLSLQRRLGLIEIWYDSAISAGQNFKDMIKAYINKADIIVLLVSADFLASEQCFGVEMHYAQEQHVSRAIPIIPVLLRPADLHDSPLEAYSYLPQNGKAVTTWENLDIALSEVAQGIHRVVKNIASHLTGRRMATRQPQFPLSNLTYRRNLFFTDRDDTLEALHRAFTSGQTRTQALYGPGGIGKTHLAIEYIYRYQHEYQATLWLSATPPELLSANLLSLADQLGISGSDSIDEQTRIDAIKRWLHSHDRWLFVLDNLEDFSLMDQLLPLNSGGHVLLITQSQTTGPFTSRLSVDQMSIEDGALLLLRCAQIISEQDVLDIASEEDRLQASKIAEELHGYPLALDQAGGFYYYQRGCYADAETYLTQALHLQEGHSLSDPSDTAQTLNSLGLLYQQLARYEPAENLYQRSLKLRERLLGPDHPKTAESHHNLAMLYGDQGNFQQAERLHLQVLALEERTKGSDHPDVASTLNNLAFIFYQQGRYAEAEATYQRALAIYERSLPPDHPNLTYPLDGLATLAEKQGNYQRAEELYQQALAICKEAFGEEHAETAHSISKLADIAESRGNYQQAEVLYQQALSIYEQALGSQHPDIAPVLNNLAFLAKKRELYEQAKSLYERALAIYEQAVGPLHPDVASVLNNLGQLARKTGNVAHAEALLKRVLDIHEHVFDQPHPDTAQSMTNLADLLANLDKFKEAESFYQQALTIRLQTSGPDHEETTRVREKYATLLKRMNRHEEAAALWQATQKPEASPSTEPSQDDYQQ